jgi:glycosyltransferase involved in cell wall biosynthesis
VEKVSVLIPTRGRYEKLEKCLKSLIDNTKYPDYEVIVIVDKDDPESIEVVKGLPYNDVEIIIKEKREMYVGKINSGFHATNSPLVVFLADDVYVQPNWLAEAVSTFNKSFPDGMGLVSFKDEFDNRIAGHGLISRKYVEEYLNGNIFWPGYQHYWCDCELTVRSKKWGRYAYAEKAETFHDRPSREGARDKIGQEGLATREPGRKLLILRQWLGFPDTMPDKVDIELPERVELHFSPDDEMYYYVGFGIDTRKRLDWEVSRERAEFLLSNFPLHWMSPFGSAWKGCYDRVSILIPARGRYEQLKECIERIYTNTCYPNYEIVVISDSDDEKISKILSKNVRNIVNPERQYYAGKINLGYHRTNSPLLVYLADDVEVNKGWLIEAVKTLKEKIPDGAGLTAFDDGHWRDKLAPHGLVSRKFCKEYLGDNIFWPEYVHYGCDAEITARAKKLGRFIYSERSKALHIRKEEVKNRPKNAQEVMNRFLKRDNQLFKKRLWLGFPNQKETDESMRLRFLPSEQLNFYQGFEDTKGEVIDTRKRLVWEVPRGTAELLLVHFHNSWVPAYSGSWPIYRRAPAGGIDPHDVCFQVWNRPEWTKRTLESIDKNTDWDLVNKFYIMDDMSEDETKRILEEYQNPKKVLIRQNFGTAYKSLVKFTTLAKTNLVFNLENDILVPKDWNLKMAKAFAQDPSVAAVRGDTQDIPLFARWITAEAGFDLSILRDLLGLIHEYKRWIGGGWTKLLDSSQRVHCCADLFFDKLDYHEDEKELIDKYYKAGWCKTPFDIPYRQRVMRQAKLRNSPIDMDSLIGDGIWGHEKHKDMEPFIAFLSGLVIATDAQMVLEVGSGWLSSAKAFLYGLERTGGKLVSCDPEKRWRDFHHSQFEFTQKLSDEVAKEWEREIDILFIDGDHTFDQVKKDFDNFSPYVRKGGFILFHDSNEPMAHSMTKIAIDKIAERVKLPAIRFDKIPGLVVMQVG